MESGKLLQAVGRVLAGLSGIELITSSLDLSSRSSWLLHASLVGMYMRLCADKESNVTRDMIPTPG